MEARAQDLSWEDPRWDSASSGQLAFLQNGDDETTQGDSDDSRECMAQPSTVLGEQGALDEVGILLLLPTLPPSEIGFRRLGDWRQVLRGASCNPCV